MNQVAFFTGRLGEANPIASVPRSKASPGKMGSKRWGFPAMFLLDLDGFGRILDEFEVTLW